MPWLIAISIQRILLISFKLAPFILLLRMGRWLWRWNGSPRRYHQQWSQYFGTGMKYGFAVIKFWLLFQIMEYIFLVERSDSLVGFFYICFPLWFIAFNRFKKLWIFKYFGLDHHRRDIICRNAIPLQNKMVPFML